MKKIQLLCMGFALAFMTACSTPKERVDELNTLIDELEQECADYSEEDWQTANTEIEELIEKLESDSEKMTQEEKEAALKAIGRYYGLLAKQGIKAVAGFAEQAMKTLPALVEGFTEAFEEEFDFVNEE